MFLHATWYPWAGGGVGLARACGQRAGDAYAITSAMRGVSLNDPAFGLCATAKHTRSDQWRTATAATKAVAVTKTARKTHGVIADGDKYSWRIHLDQGNGTETR